ncbi:biofilm regulation phosphoprotein SiaC [Cyanobium sp. PCC 7001]|uniref:biofilm regulation phosphoprotein SiaC n=1 Tax=Cyanobium sp. PCC 7001 TaxID=180281 RepID=UPI0005BB01A6|nr:biofilm regulation phosphoprotein SiaC [Cyanobium sp. PCC 7001]
MSPSSTTTSDLNLAPTSSSPYVRGDWQMGRLSMAGESYPENAHELFDQVISWVCAYLNETSKPLDVELQLAYLNTSSVRGMIEIFDAIQEASDGGRELTVTWLWDEGNHRSLEMGEEFKEDYTFPFDIRMV